MEFINKVELQGIVGKMNVERIADTNQVRFSLVTEYAYKQSNGCAVVETMWWNCIQNDVPELSNVMKIKKGDHVHVKGRLRLRRYTDMEGNERTMNEVICHWIEIAN